jgi:hypothetical protein
MRRMAFAVVALVGFCAPAQAETVPLFEGLPATYTPGQQFTFTLRVPELPEFSSYSLELVFGTEVPNPPLLAFPTVAPSDRYVFGSSDDFGFALGVAPGSPEVRLTLADPFDPTTPPRPGVFVVAGENDTLATITVAPNAELRGPITLTIGNSTEFNYNTEQQTFDPPAPVVIEQGPLDGGNPVPAPPGVVLLGIGGLVFGLRARLRR